MLESKAYQTYFCFCFWRESSETKVKADSDTSPKKKNVQDTKGTRLKSKAKVAKSNKKKQLAKMPKAKGLNVLSEWLSQDDEDAEEDSDRNDDSEETESNNDGDDLTHPNLSTYKADEEEEEEEEEKADDEEVVSALESEMSKFSQTSQFTKVVSSIPGIVDTYLASKIKEAVDVAVQLQTNKLREEAQAKNQEFLNQVDSTMKAIIKEHKLKSPRSCQRLRNDQDKDEDPSAGSNRGSKRRRSGKEAESSKEPKNKESKSTSSSKSASKSEPKSSGKSAHAEEHDQKAADLEDQPHQEFNTGNEDVYPMREALNEDVWHRNPLRPLNPDREWHTTKTVDNRPPQAWITQMAQAVGTQSSFNEFLATPIDFSVIIMHRLKIDNLTQEVLTSPTYDLIKGTCKSVVELEYHLEEVFKATNDRLDWHNPEGKLYPMISASPYR
ncbi:hypothetical protein Tco_1055159 [Tanacetum coccineum]|uniref:Uncharacterized protein n=1 Tax=Tanacetum coccineum TaxID=301880 RepID=A0ABQ5H0P4_9ASTR